MTPHGYTIQPGFRTTRLMMRPLEMDDAKDLFEYASDPQVARTVTWEAHRTVEDSRAFLRHVTRGYGTGPVLHWGIHRQADDKLIGTIGLAGVHDEHQRAEIGYALARPCWNQGLMTEALRATIDSLFRGTPLNRIEGRCLPDNAASSRVMRKSGMSFEGILRQCTFVKGQFRDLECHSILRRDWETATGR
ncbi:MAG: GNAT family N-acetyltransferase [Tepidisphaeraceae bacterium]